jgi:cytochrome c
LGHRQSAQGRSPWIQLLFGFESQGRTWSYRDLADYLNNPRKFAPGTSMAFAGIVSNRRIADLLAYLRTLSDNPAPLPN